MADVTYTWTSGERSRAGWCVRPGHVYVPRLSWTDDEPPVISGTYPIRWDFMPDLLEGDWRGADGKTGLGSILSRASDPPSYWLDLVPFEPPCRGMLFLNGGRGGTWDLSLDEMVPSPRRPLPPPYTCSFRNVDSGALAVPRGAYEVLAVGSGSTLAFTAGNEVWELSAPEGLWVPLGGLLSAIGTSGGVVRQRGPVLPLLSFRVRIG